MAGAGLPRAKHAGRASDGGQAEVLRLAGAHPDLVPQGVVDDGVTVLAGKDRTAGECWTVPDSNRHWPPERIPNDPGARRCRAPLLRPQIHYYIPLAAHKHHQSPGGA